MTIDFSFEDGFARDIPVLELTMPATWEGTAQAQTLIALGSVFQLALEAAHDKNKTYGDAWRKQGWMGNLARMMSKMSRIKHMGWRDHSMDNSNESLADSALDLVNITGFFIINRSEDNKWGVL